MSERNAVLLVEDSPNVLDLNMRVLEKEGYIVMPARGLKEARELIEGVNPQAVVLEVDLPDGSGLDFCRELRRTKTIPILFLTARNREEDKAEGLAAGADDYIVKPFRLETLLDSLSTALEKRQKEDIPNVTREELK